MEVLIETVLLCCQRAFAPNAVNARRDFGE